jgi:hypothetical protein
MNDTVIATPATGIDKAAEAFAEILTTEEGGTQENRSEAPKAAKPAEADEAEAHETSDEAEETLDEADDEADAEEAEAEEEAEDDAAEEEEPSDDAEQPQIDPETYKVTVKVDGKTMEVSLQEAILGYQRGKDYARKTEAISHERKAIAEEMDAIREERQAYSQLLPALQQQLSELMQSQEPDWERLYAENPVEWVRQRELFRDKQARIEAAQIEMQRLQHAEASEQQKALGQYIAGERDRLLEAIPAWKDKARWEKDRLALRDYGKRLGFSDEELAEAYDHRAVVALYKAMRYDRITTAKKPAPAPAKAPPPQRAPARAATPKPVSDTTRAKMRLAKTGRVSDAAKVFESLI